MNTSSIFFCHQASINGKLQHCAQTGWHLQTMARSWRTDECQRLGWSRSRGTTTKFPQKRKWRDRHKAPAHDVHTSHPTSSTKTIPDPGSVQQQLWLRQQRVWRQLPDLCQMQSHISLSRDLPRQSAYLHNLQCWTATLANLYTTLQARTTTTIQH